MLLDTSTWIGVYMPLFVLFFIIWPQQREARRLILQKIKKRRGVGIMTNEIIKKYMGKYCKITTGSMGTTVAGKIRDVNENWIEVETKKGNELVNADFVQSIKIV